MSLNLLQPFPIPLDNRPLIPLNTCHAPTLQITNPPSYSLIVGQLMETSPPPLLL